MAISPKVTDFGPVVDTFREDVIAGLGRPQKEIPSKYLYDEKGARLFDEICELEEYYPTRTELGILGDHIAEMAALLGRGCMMIEYGSGSGIKTRVLLDALNDPAAYVPIDISRDQLVAWTRELRSDDSYRALEIHPVCADYTARYELPETVSLVNRRVVYFPGSTIGNFDPDAARQFLTHIAEVCGRGGSLLIGVDLKKDRDVLERAYNDAAGVTADFNLNVLARANRELGADFRLDLFYHKAFYNDEASRIEMHVVSRCPQSVSLNGKTYLLDDGETIRTECSYKYSFDGFQALVRSAGFDVARVWTDSKRFFSVQYLTVR